tara:strand:- start:966 stop:1376 length:411 start_codon:yes stop_codon:yes gene_type:complete
MSKAIGIDFGLKRTGISISDELCIIATPLTTIPSEELIGFLKEYIQNEGVETLVLGYPLGLNGEDTDITPNVRLLKQALEKEFVTISVRLYDERMTSKIAHQVLVSGVKKKKRKEKGVVDKMSATIILQDYLNAKT